MHFLKTYKFTLIFIASIVVAAILFTLGIFDKVVGPLGQFGYLGAFLIGMLFSSAFTTPSATLLFVSLGEYNLNPFAIALIGGVGAMMSDLLFYEVLSGAFMNEAHMLVKKIFTSRTLRTIKRIEHIRLVRAGVGILAGGIIASPLPDEIGIALFSLINFKPKFFSFFCLVCNIIGIFALVSIGNSLA